MKKLVLLTITVLAFLTTNANPTVKNDAGTKSETKTEAVTLISGLIEDNSTNETLAGAVISYEGQTIYSDLDGNFVLKNVKPGKITLTVNMISYAEQTIELDTTDSSTVKIKLKHI